MTWGHMVRIYIYIGMHQNIKNRARNRANIIQKINQNQKTTLKKAFAETGSDAERDLEASWLNFKA